MKLEEIDEFLCDPELYSDPDKIFELGQERDMVQSKLDNFYENWIILTEG